MKKYMNLIFEDILANRKITKGLYSAEDLSFEIRKLIDVEVCIKKINKILIELDLQEDLIYSENKRYSDKNIKHYFTHCLTHRGSRLGYRSLEFIDSDKGMRFNVSFKWEKEVIELIAKYLILEG